jgi:hypothetical protein
MAESFYYTYLEKADNLKDILSSYAEERKLDQCIENCRSAFIIPNGNRHGSGYGCFDIFACIPDGTHDHNDKCKVFIFKCGGCCDDISFEGEHFRMDCMHPSGIIRIWNRRGFTITEDLSSISFVENGNKT